MAKSQDKAKKQSKKEPAIKGTKAKKRAKDAAKAAKGK